MLIKTQMRLFWHMTHLKLSRRWPKPRRLSARREQVVQLMEIDGRAVNGRYTTCCGASRVRRPCAS